MNHILNLIQNTGGGMESSCQQNLSIYELRTIAREAGARSPTTLKKSELILQIQNIGNGKQKPHYSSRGRKPRLACSKVVEENIAVQVRKFIDFAKKLEKEFELEEKQ